MNMKTFLFIFLFISLWGCTHAQTKTADSSSVLFVDTLVHNWKTDFVDSSSVLTFDTSRPPQHHPVIIKGKVQDINNSEGLSFAVILFKGTMLGTTADIDGVFAMTVDSLPSDSLRFQALGYKSISLKLPKLDSFPSLIVELEREASMLKEVTIRANGEDPAIILMRKIIKNKPNNDINRLESYSYEAYNRLEADLQRMTKAQFQKIPILKNYAFIFDNLDTISEARPYLPLYLTETISDNFFSNNPKKQREIIKASIVKGLNNENFVKYLGTLYQRIDVYDNYIPVFDKKFISPLNNNALFFYRFTLSDTAVVNGHRLIHVQFTPKRGGEYCFTGDFWVADTVCAIQRISMDVDKAANLNWVDKVSLFEEFAEQEDSIWFCTKEKFVANFTIYNSGKLPGFIGRKTTTYHKIKINHPTIDSEFNNEAHKGDLIKQDSVTLKKDDWWLQNRPDTLNKNEKSIYKMVDTIESMPITRIYKNSITFLATGVKDIGWLQLGPYYYLYSRNPVEGNRVRISLGASRKLKDAQFSGFLAYGDKDNKFKYGLSGLYIAKRNPRLSIYGYLAHDINNTPNYYDQVGLDNIFSAFFRKANVPWKLAFSNEQRIQIYKEYNGGFSHRLILQHRDFTPYRPLPAEGIFTDASGQPSLSATSSEVGMELRFAYKDKYLEGQYRRIRLANRYPVLNLTYMQGIKGVLNGSYEYGKIRFSVTESINIPPFGHLYYNLFAGKYFGKLPYSLLEIHPGNEFMYYNRQAFQMMNNYEFLSDQYVGFNIEHNFGGGVFNYIPVLKKLKLRQFWTAKGVLGSLSTENTALNMNKGYEFRTLKGEPYLELGTGVANIFHLFRIDFVWRVNPKPISEELISKYFGIFCSVKFEL